MKKLFIILICISAGLNKTSGQTLVIEDSSVVAHPNGTPIIMDGLVPVQDEKEFYLWDLYGSKLYEVDLSGMVKDSFDLLSLGGWYIIERMVKRDGKFYSLATVTRFCITQGEKILATLRIPVLDTNELRLNRSGEASMTYKDGYFYESTAVYAHLAEDTFNAWRQKPTKEYYHRPIVSVYALVDDKLTFVKNIAYRPAYLLDTLQKYPFLDHQHIYFTDKNFYLTQVIDSCISVFDYNGKLQYRFGTRGKHWVTTSLSSYPGNSSFKTLKDYMHYTSILNLKYCKYESSMVAGKYALRFYTVPVADSETWYVQVYKNKKLQYEDKWNEKIRPVEIIANYLYAVKRDDTGKIELYKYQL